MRNRPFCGYPEDFASRPLHVMSARLHAQNKIFRGYFGILQVARDSNRSLALIGSWATTVGRGAWQLDC